MYLALLVKLYFRISEKYINLGLTLSRQNCVGHVGSCQIPNNV